jgi:two-component system response regulator ResD
VESSSGVPGILSDGPGGTGAGGYDDFMSGPARILVVDDEARIAEVVQGYLEGQGHTVDRAATGEEALAAAASRRPDLVILDLGLPGMSGEEVCRRLRAESDVPIIMLTAKDAEEDLVNGLQLGADDYMTKPFSPRELTARARRNSARTRARGRSPSGGRARARRRAAGRRQRPPARHP